MTLFDGTRLGPYEIQSPLGAGGMGEVYKARDTRLDRAVAIKVLPAHVASDPDVRQRFEREARAVAALNHPHICTLHDIGNQDGTDFLVMEYLEGETLADRLAKGALPLDQALRYGIEIADALDKAHRAGIVHRDLKPGNIMLTKGGTKLLDFGLAKTGTGVVAGTGLSMLPTTPPNLTAHGTILGTFQYMAPEQLEGQEADARTDIFAFGAVLYEMLTGQKAFEGKSHASLIGAILKDEPPAVSALQQSVPPSLDRVVGACFAKDPDDRWQTARDLRRQLLWVAAAGSQPNADALSLRPGPRRGRLLVPAVAAIGAALIAGWAAWVLKPERPSRVARFTVTLPVDERFAAPGRHLVAISPEGTHLVYVANGRLNLRPIDQLNGTPIRGTEVGINFGRMPFFSPDGLWVGFWQEGELRKVSTSGGTPIKLCDQRSLPFGATWGPADTILYGQGSQGIWKISANGGTPELLIPVDASNGEEAHGPQLLPDGDHILFTLARSASWDDAQIVVQSLASGDRKVLIEAGRDARYVPTGHLVYARAGTLFAAPFDIMRLEVGGAPVALVDNIADGGNATGAVHFSISSSGTLVYVPAVAALAARLLNYVEQQDHTLVWVDRAGREEPVGLPPRAYRGARLSPNGTHLAVEIGNQLGDIWVSDLARLSLAQLTFNPEMDAFPVWTRDGRRIVFTAESGRMSQLRWQAADGTGMPEELLAGESDLVATDMSPNDEQLVFYERAPTGTGTRDLKRLTLNTRQVFPLLQTQLEEQNGYVSPDGRWLAYQSYASGQPEIYVRPFSPTVTGQWSVSMGGGVHPLWSRSGTELFYGGIDGSFMRVAVESDAPVWTAAAPVKLFEPGRYLRTNPLTSGRPYDITPDGERFLMITSDPASESSASLAHLVVVQNWTEELRQRVPTD